MNVKNGICTIPIKSYDELRNIICGKDKNYKHDLRKDFIFRGLSKSEYKLIPSSFRKNKLNQLEIDSYIEEDVELWIKIDEDKKKQYNLNTVDRELFDIEHWISIDKYGNPNDNENSTFKVPENKLQKVKEEYLLNKFFKSADKSGLKINTNGSTRELIHPSIPFTDELSDLFYNYPEIISLAQHYGIPTKALDWSYDYKVSLYFAVKDVLIDNRSDCLLWALNYKLLENQIIDNDYRVNLSLYRPEYNTNPNLNAQKGLFTFIDNYVGDYDKPLDEIISSELTKNKEERCKGIKNNKKIVTVPPHLTCEDIIFYKFIIPNEIKADILNELYLDGYSEEYLFPGYRGVTDSIFNQVKLKNILNNNTKQLKKNILLLINEKDIKKIKNKEKMCEFIKLDFKNEIENIFIYLNGNVVGYFKGNKIIKDNPLKLWEKYGEFSGMSKEESEYFFKDEKFGFAILFYDLKIFNYPITLCDFEVKDDVYCIDETEELKFLLNFVF